MRMVDRGSMYSLISGFVKVRWILGENYRDSDRSQLTSPNPLWRARM